MSHSYTNGSTRLGNPFSSLKTFTSLVVSRSEEERLSFKPFIFSLSTLRTYEPLPERSSSFPTPPP